MASSGAFVVLILSMVSELRSKWKREKREREERKIPLPRAKSQRGRKFIPPRCVSRAGGERRKRGRRKEMREREGEERERGKEI